MTPNAAFWLLALLLAAGTLACLLPTLRRHDEGGAQGALAFQQSAPIEISVSGALLEQGPARDLPSGGHDASAARGTGCCSQALCSRVH